MLNEVVAYSKKWLLSTLFICENNKSKAHVVLFDWLVKLLISKMFVMPAPDIRTCLFTLMFTLCGTGIRCYFIHATPCEHMSGVGSIM